MGKILWTKIALLVQHYKAHEVDVAGQPLHTAIVEPKDSNLMFGMGLHAHVGVDPQAQNFTL